MLIRFIVIIMHIFKSLLLIMDLWHRLKFPQISLLYQGFTVYITTKEVSQRKKNTEKSLLCTYIHTCIHTCA